VKGMKDAQCNCVQGNREGYRAKGLRAPHAAFPALSSRRGRCLPPRGGASERPLLPPLGPFVRAYS
jgi:hypothetical protein